MSADFFLSGGFVFSLLWHGLSWWVIIDSGRNSDSDTKVNLALINLGLSGVALCGFGYLAFGTI